MKIYYTVREYKENVEIELKYFLDYEDNEEYDFWNEQKELYKKCIESIEPVSIAQTFAMLANSPFNNKSRIITEVYNKVHFDDEGERNYNLELAENLKRTFDKILKIIENELRLCRIVNNIPEPTENDKTTATTVTTELKTIENPKQTKSLQLDGRALNLSERFIIANKLLDIDNKIRTLKIPDLEKYQLLSYILGCNKDNARNLMNGTYRSKDRDLNDYFNELGLNK